MADKKPELGEIKTASVRISPVDEDYTYKVGDFKPETTSFFFNLKDSGFISFSHSIGWNPDALTQYELKVIDPGEDFETEFIAMHYYNRSANSDVVSRSYYITYGIGKETDLIQWSPPQLAYLIKIDVAVRSEGAREYTLLFGSLPSLKNNPSANGWPIVDQGNRLLLSAGKAGFNNKKVIDLFRKADESALYEKGEEAEGRTYKTTVGEGLDDRTRALDKDERKSARKRQPSISNIRKEVAEDWINFLDEATYLCIKRYIENITGLGPTETYPEGNVIVVLPSFKYTRVMQRMASVILRDTWIKPVVGARKYTSGIVGPSNLINQDLFKNFTNLQAFDLSLKSPGVIDHFTHRKLMYKNKLREADNGIIVFQANNSDFTKKGEDNVKLDWMKVLKTFGEQFSEEINSVDLEFRTLYKYGEYFNRVDRAQTNFGKFTHVEIRDKRRLDILKAHGLIGRAKDYCFIWGEFNMIKLLLGQLPKDDKKKIIGTSKYALGTTSTNKAFYDEVLKLFPGSHDSKERVRKYNIIENKLDFHDLYNNPNYTEKELVLSNIGNMHRFVHNANNLKKISDIDLYTSIKATTSDMVAQAIENVKSVTKNSGAWIVELGKDHFVPVLRSNVRNPNVLDLRLQMNPHYWGDLAGTVDAMIPTYNKRERARQDISISFNLEEAILKKAGVKAGDSAYLKWLGQVKQEIKNLTVDKGQYDIKGHKQERVFDWGNNLFWGYTDLGYIDAMKLTHVAASKDRAAWLKGEKGGTSEQVLRRSASRREGGFPGVEGSPIHEAIMAIPMPESWKMSDEELNDISNGFFSPKFHGQRLPKPEKYDLMMHIMTNFVVPSRQIYNKLRSDMISTDIFNQTQLFYEKLYSKAGPQLDATTYPMFLYSRYSDIGEAMWVEMRQPYVLEGINPEVDVVSLDQRIKRRYTDLGSGLYFIQAFEHTIKNDRVQSRFRLTKNPYTYLEGIEEHDSFLAEREKDGLWYLGPLAPPSWHGRAASLREEGR